MALHRFLIGDHVVHVDHRNDEPLSTLVPSMGVFRTEDDGAPITTVVIDDTATIVLDGTHLGTFDSGDAVHAVYRTDDGSYRFSLTDAYGVECSLMSATPDFSHVSVVLLPDNPSRRAYAASNAMMMAYAFSTADRGTLLMHSSVIRNDGRGYMFLGKSGTGKSTHTRLWRENIPGSDLINDDNPVLRVIGDEVRVYGSPWSGKTPCYRQISVSVGGITMLEQRPYNRIERQGIMGAMASLMQSASNMRWDHRVNTGMYDTLEQVLSRVPVYLMGCLPDADAARVSYKQQHG